MTALQIRRHTYRGTDGFLVMGERCRIFCETRESAEHIRNLVRLGIEENVADFTGHTLGLCGRCVRCGGTVAA